MEDGSPPAESGGWLKVAIARASMNILLSCLQSPHDYPISAYRHWEKYFKRGIAEAGHKWVEVSGIDWVAPLVACDRGMLAAWRANTWERILDFIRDSERIGGVDLFLSYCYPDMIERGAVQEIRRRGIPCVNFFCDNVREHTAVPEAFGCYDLHWVPEALALPRFRAAGCKALHLPMPCWVPPEQRTASAREDSRAVFVGSPDAMRRELLGEAVSRVPDLFVAGAGWNDSEGQADGPSPLAAPGGLRLLTNQAAFVRRHGLAGFARKLARRLAPVRCKAIPPGRLLGKLSGADYAAVSRDSQIVLGVNRVETFTHSWTKPLVYSRLRDIEGPMMGACYLTEWTDDLAAFYQIGEEVEAYRTVEELVAQIARLRTDVAHRQQLRRRGQARALADHSVARSIARLFAALG